ITHLSNTYLYSTLQRPLNPPLFPYTTLFRSILRPELEPLERCEPPPLRPKPPNRIRQRASSPRACQKVISRNPNNVGPSQFHKRSEEHTSELQSPDHLVCRLLLEKKTSLTHS